MALLRQWKDSIKQKSTKKQKKDEKPRTIMPTTIPLSELFSHPSFNSIVVHALLGIQTNFESTCSNAWFAYDYALLYYILSHNPSYCSNRSVWLSSTPIPYPPQILFGEAGSKRLGFHVPPDFPTVISPDFPSSLPGLESTARAYQARLVEQVAALTKGQLLLLILSGHGNCNPDFLMLEPNGGWLSISKTVLEEAVQEGRRRQLEPGAGHITLFSNACYSGAFASPLWTTITGATAEEQTRALSQSPSGQCRGSEVSYCMVGAALERQAINLDDIECDCENTPTLVLAADRNPPTVEEHWNISAAFRRFLLCSEQANPFFCTYRTSPPPSPFTLSPTLRFTVHPAGTPAQLLAWDAVYPSSSSSSTPTGLQSPAFTGSSIDILKGIVRDVLSQNIPAPESRDFWLYTTCRRLSDKGFEPSQLSTTIMWDVANRYHQSRLARHVALWLGWTTTFGDITMILANSHLGRTSDIQRMSGAGMDPYILSRWPPMIPIPHMSAALWLAGLWVGCGQPVVENWSKVVRGCLETTTTITF